MGFLTKMLWQLTKMRNWLMLRFIIIRKRWKV